jgi:hypothetical protein
MIPILHNIYYTRIVTVCPAFCWSIDSECDLSAGDRVNSDPLRIPEHKLRRPVGQSDVVWCGVRIEFCYLTSFPYRQRKPSMVRNIIMIDCRYREILPLNLSGHFNPSTTSELEPGILLKNSITFHPFDRNSKFQRVCRICEKHWVITEILVNGAMVVAQSAL